MPMQFRTRHSWRLQANADDILGEYVEGDEDGEFYTDDDDDDDEEDDEDDNGSESTLEGESKGIVSSKKISFRGVTKVSAQNNADDVKSRFTDYSMTSSILPRSERLLRQFNVAFQFTHCVSRHASAGRSLREAL